MLERPEHPSWIRQWVDVLFDSLGDVGGAHAQYCGWSGLKKFVGCRKLQSLSPTCGDNSANCTSLYMGNYKAFQSTCTMKCLTTTVWAVKMWFCYLNSRVWWSAVVVQARARWQAVASRYFLICLVKLSVGFVFESASVQMTDTRRWGFSCYTIFCRKQYTRCI